jgi:translation elongation factor EF-4
MHNDSDGPPSRRMRPKQDAEAHRRAAMARRARPRKGRVTSIGSVELPQEAFLAILKVEN